MIATMLYKEWRAMARDGRSLALLLALAALLIGMTMTAARQHEADARERAAVAAATRAQWDSQGDKHPHRGAHFGLYAFRPDNVLAALDPGLTPYLGQALWLEPHRRNMTRFEPAADALPSDRFGRMDVAFVLSTLVPLLIVALSFDAISRERESGTLRMLHGIGLPPRRLLSAKLAALVSAFAVIGATPLFVVAHEADVAPDVLWRAVAMSAACIAYFAVTAAVALAISARCASSRAALFWLIGWWLATTLVVPRATAAVANHVYPLPSAGAFWAAIQHDYQHGLPGDGNLAARGRRVDADLLRRYGVNRLEDLPVGAAPLRRLARDAYADRVHALHFDALWRRYAEQERVLRIAAVLSPTLALRGLSMKLAGTDLSHQRHFEERAEQYRREVNTTIDTWDAHHTRGITSFEDKYAGDALWRNVAPLSYTPPDVRFALGKAWPEIALLLAWACSAVALLTATARRLRP